VHVLSYKDPAGLDAGSASGGATTVLAWTLFAAFALGSLAFWGYFRLRGDEGSLAGALREARRTPATV
jgi:hypothetical protein